MTRDTARTGGRWGPGPQAEERAPIGRVDVPVAVHVRRDLVAGRGVRRRPGIARRVRAAARLEERVVAPVDVAIAIAIEIAREAEPGFAGEESCGRPDEGRGLA